MDGGLSSIDWRPIQGRVVILLVTSCYLTGISWVTECNPWLEYRLILFHHTMEMKLSLIGYPYLFSGMKWLPLFLFPPGLDASNSLLVSIHSPWWRGAWREKCHPRKHSTMTQPKIKLDICRSRLQSSDR